MRAQVFGVVPLPKPPPPPTPPPTHPFTPGDPGDGAIPGTAPSSVTQQSVTQGTPYPSQLLVLPACRPGLSHTPVTLQSSTTSDWMNLSVTAVLRLVFHTKRIGHKLAKCLNG